MGQWGIEGVKEMIDEVDTPDDCAEGEGIDAWDGDESARDQELPGDGSQGRVEA